MGDLSGQGKVNWKEMFMIAGAFVSYMVGAGFASGNEAFQFFGSWGAVGSILSILGGAAVTGITCYCLYWISQKVSFEKTSDIYRYLGGKYLNWFLQFFVFVDVFCSFMIMFSGAGSLLNQLWGLPQWAGSLLLGVISGVVALGGLKAVENVLGAGGILIQLYLIVFGVITLFHPAASLSQASGAMQAVEEGLAYQANLFALPPFGWIPGLSSLNNGLFEGILYSGCLTINGIPFILTLGKRVKNKKELGVSSVLTTAGMYGCVALVILLILTNFDSMINPATGIMYAFPVIAAVEHLWPAGGWTYSIVIFVGIFTTTTGFLWVLCDWFLPGQDGTKKNKALIAGLILFGMTLGGVFPFAVITNTLFPFFGLSGVIASVIIVVRAIRAAKETASA